MTRSNEMAWGRKIKTEMNGTGGGRWDTRANAKKASRKVRRQRDKKESRGHGY